MSKIITVTLDDDIRFERGSGMGAVTIPASKVFKFYMEPDDNNALTSRILKLELQASITASQVESLVKGRIDELFALDGHIREIIKSALDKKSN